MENLIRLIDSRIASLGGKKSKSRSHVVRVFFRTGTHMTVEELVRASRKGSRCVGTATVYRTLKLLARLGFAKELDFGEGVTRYESNLSAHHDHLICTRCGRVTEFKDTGIETLQERAARRHGFSPATHRLDIYGLCRGCTTDGEGSEGS